MKCPFNEFKECIQKECPFYYKSRIDNSDKCRRADEIMEREEVYKIIKKSLPLRR